MQIFQQFVDTFSGSIVDQKDVFATGINQPLLHHGDIGVRRVDFRNNADERALDKGPATGAEQIKGLVGCLYDSNHIGFKGKTGQPYTEMLRFCIFSRRVNCVGGCIDILSFFRNADLHPSKLVSGKFFRLRFCPLEIIFSCDASLCFANFFGLDRFESPVFRRKTGRRLLRQSVPAPSRR